MTSFWNEDVAGKLFCKTLFLIQESKNLAVKVSGLRVFLDYHH